MRLMLFSDTHGERSRTRNLLRQYPGLDLYIDLGDIGFDLKELSDCIVVKGNHDSLPRLPLECIVSVEDRKILCIHGDRFEAGVMEEVLSLRQSTNLELPQLCLNVFVQHLVDYAKRKHCDTVFFGHTHIRRDKEKDGIRLVNPGSLCYGMDGYDRSYALVTIEGKNIHTRFFQLCDE